MKSARWLFLAILCSTIAIPQTVCAADTNSVTFNKQPDQRVTKLLRETDRRFLIDQDGDFLLTYNFGTNGTQDVWIDSRTVTFGEFGELEVREIWSVAYSSKNPLPNTIYKKLLERSRIVGFGGWTMSRQDNICTITFRAKVDAKTLNPKSIEAIADFVAVTANGMKNEIEKTGGNIWSIFD
jgi:hypothetical protein